MMEELVTKLIEIQIILFGLDIMISSMEVNMPTLSMP